MAEMKPTPAPQINRPGTIRPNPVDAVSRIQPIVNIPHPAMIVVRRPMKSAKSPAMIAPKNVPHDRMDVVSDWSLAGKWKAATAVLSLGSGYGR